MQYSCCGSRRCGDEFTVEIGKNPVHGCINFYCEEFLFFSAADGKNPVSGKL